MLCIRLVYVQTNVRTYVTPLTVKKKKKKKKKKFHCNSCGEIGLRNIYTGFTQLHLVDVIIILVLYITSLVSAHIHCYIYAGCRDGLCIIESLHLV